MSEITVRTAASDLGKLNAVGVIVPWGGGAEWQCLIARGKVGIVSVMDSRVEAAVRLTQLIKTCSID